MSFGKLIAEARQNATPKLSQGALAEKVGTFQVMVSRWENETAVPTVAQLAKLADELDLDHGVVLRLAADLRRRLDKQVKPLEASA